MLSLSIIIPVFNAEQHIPSFINYLKKHADPSIEIIFINDGSTDNSLALLQESQELLPCCQILNKPNGGAATARNLGIKKAKGKYLIFVDIDDCFELPLIMNKITWVEQEQLELFAYKYDYISNDKRTNNKASDHPITYNHINTGLFFLEQGYQPSSICVFIILKSFLTSNNLYFVEGITHEDVEVSLRYMLSAKRVYFCSEILYHYFQHEGSVTNQNTAEKKQKYLFDEIKIASLMKNQEAIYPQLKTKKIIQKNYNAVVWNLIYIVYKSPQSLNKDARVQMIAMLEAHGLYPIKGALKTNFQRLSTLFINRKWILNLINKISVIK